MGARLRATVAVALLGAAVFAAVSRSHELREASTLLAHPRWGWLVVAVGLEAASMLFFARIQQRLLRAGDVEIGLGPMVGITLAGNALALSLPGGVAWGAPWVFRRLRRRGADNLLSGWVVLVAGALGSFALFLVVVAGVEIAGGGSLAADARAPLAVLALIPVLVVLGAVLARRWPPARAALRAVSRLNASTTFGRWLNGAVATVAARMSEVRLHPRAWAGIGALAILNWLNDCACLVACVWVVGGSVPWRGVLLAYALSQAAACLPLVPGGLGLVEGSLAVLLMSSGMPATIALASVVLYRIVSFWVVVPAGWGAWGYIAFAEHRADTRRERSVRARRTALPVPPVGAAPSLEHAA
jgi:uncharacterized membrane protein YbhN (UPF0104 family)